MDIKITSHVNVRPKQYFYVQKCVVIFLIKFFFFKNKIFYKRNMREK